MKSKYKAGDKIKFPFAGSIEIGIIESIEKTTTSNIYKVTDGKYKYSVRQEEIIIEK